jgi:hypothetical protein
MTMEYCFSRCNSRGWKLAGLKNGINCMCGDDLAPWAVKDAGLQKCSIPCPGDRSETCGGVSNVQVASFGCLGPPLNQGSNAVIASCTDLSSQQWTVGSGGSICLVNSTTACLNAFSRKEHASVIVGSNHTPWALVTATPQKPNCPSATGQGCAACTSIVDRYTVCTMHYTLCTMHYTVCTMHYTYTTKPVHPMWTGTVHSAYCLVHSAYCLVHSAYCIVHSAYCIVHSAYCIVHTVPYLMPVDTLWIGAARVSGAVRHASGQAR